MFDLLEQYNPPKNTNLKKARKTPLKLKFKKQLDSNIYSYRCISNIQNYPIANF